MDIIIPGITTHHEDIQIENIITFLGQADQGC